MENYKAERDRISGEIDSRLSHWLNGQIDKTEKEIIEHKKKLENLTCKELREMKLEYLTELSILNF